MKFLLAGASGYLGTALRDRLAREGHQVRRLVRGQAMTATESRWDPQHGEVDQAVVDDADVVVNLAGSPLYGNPHSAKFRQTLRDSRVLSTRTLAEAIARSPGHPAFLAQNGTAYYGDRGAEVLTEDSGTAPGSLLTEITVEWQAATEPAAEAGSRVVVLRTGPVLGPGGGAFKILRRVFRTGLAGRLGDGSQYFPIISLADWVGATVFLATHEASRGPYNLTAPDPCTNAEFTAALGRRLHRPTVIPVPAPVLDTVAGRLSGELLGSLRISPAKLLEEGFNFEQPDLEAVLSAAMR